MEVEQKRNFSPSFGFDGPDLAVITLLSLLAYVNLLATIHELITRYWNQTVSNGKENKTVAALRCFSIPANVRQLLLPVQGRGSSRNFGSINGIRVIFTCQIVVYHVWLSGNFLSSDNDSVNGMAWWFQFVSFSFVSVDAFFLVSGLLTAYVTLRGLDCNKGKFDIARFYIHRYLRLTPLYGVIFGITATLLPHIKHESTEARNRCRENWWNHLLYVNNFFYSTSACMGHAWYLAVDMQLFLVVPPFIYLLWRRPVAGRLVLVVFAIASAASECFNYALLDLPMQIHTRRKEIDTHKALLINHGAVMWHRAIPYLCGVLVGWMLYRNTKRDYIPHIPKTVVRCGWILSFAITVGLMFGMIPYLDETEVPVVPKTVRLTYALLYRTAWSLVWSWTIYACSCGYGGALNRFLSWKWFDPLGRLTFCVYLLHVALIGVFFKYMNDWGKPIDRNSSAHLWIVSLAVIVLSFVLALVFCLMVEFPFQSLDKIILPSKKPSKQEALSELSATKI